MSDLTHVEFKSVSRSFGGVPVLRGINARFSTGETTVLMGPNGAGKSTLLSILGTRLSPTRGQVHFLAGSDPLDKHQVRAQLGWLSHEPFAYLELSGRANIELTLRLHGLDASHYERIAERVGLGKFAERPLGTMSRGQKQRVALGRAICNNPRLLLLDEPWTGLDQDSQKLVERIADESARAGCILLIVSHEPGTAERLGARELVLRGGKLEPTS